LARGEQLTSANQKVFGTVSEFLDGIKLAKSYGAEQRYSQTFTDTILNLRRQLLAHQGRVKVRWLIY
jgi:abortive infection bacteriophage resistance protein